jgi:uncharacterized protein (TIGR02722 family)
MNIKEIVRMGCVASLLVMLSACKTKIESVDPGSNIQLTTDFGATAVNDTIAKMVDDILVFPPMVELTKEKRPVIVVYPIRNKTSQHINTEQILTSIRTRLLRSGKFIFVNRDSDNVLIKEVKYQRDSGLVDRSKVKKFGKQVAPDFALTGTITEIVQKNDDIKDVFYNVSLELKNLETGVLEWADEKKIRFKKTKSTFGF